MVRIFKSIVLALSLLTVAATAAQAQVRQGVPVEYGLLSGARDPDHGARRGSV